MSVDHSEPPLGPPPSDPQAELVSDADQFGISNEAGEAGAVEEIDDTAISNSDSAIQETGDSAISNPVCASASPEVLCLSRPEYELTMHPPRSAGEGGCGHHTVHLCVHCAAAIVRNAERNLLLAARGLTQPLACPVCGKRFTRVQDIVTNVERL